MVLNLNSKESKEEKLILKCYWGSFPKRGFRLDWCHKRYIGFKLMQKKMGRRNGWKSTRVLSSPHPFSHLFISHETYIYYHWYSLFLSIQGTHLFFHEHCWVTVYHRVVVRFQSDIYTKLLTECLHVVNAQ